jgi:hypothetical protein
VLVAGAIVVFVSIVAFKMIRSAARWTERVREETAAQRSLLVRMRREMATGARVADSVLYIESAIGEIAPRVLVGRTTREAILDLRARVTVAIAGAGARMNRVVQQPDSSRAGDVARARLEVGFDGDIGSLARAIAAIERDSGIVVTGFDVTAADPKSPDDAQEMLHANVRVAGWYLARAAAAGGSTAAEERGPGDAR